MNRRVYIETTIPSFYHEPRSEPDMVARRDWTRAWWELVGHDPRKLVEYYRKLQERHCERLLTQAATPPQAGKDAGKLSLFQP